MGLETLEPGENWALPPKFDQHNSRMWHPSVKWGVSRGSASHTTEFFGPLLSVMEAQSLEDAVNIANGTEYGLSLIHISEPTRPY